MGLDRWHAEEEHGPDLGVGPALADGHGDLALAVVEQGQALPGAGPPVMGRAGHPVDQPPGDGRGQHRETLRNAIQLLGVALTLQGLSGAIDRLAVKPFFGVFLNAFNRFILPRIDALDGYELLANLSLAAVGLLLVAVTARAQPS